MKNMNYYRESDNYNNKLRLNKVIYNNINFICHQKKIVANI